MPAPIIVSRVRATLHRQGYQGFTQEQILNAANAMSIDVNNPTSEDTKAVVNSLKELSSPTDMTTSEPISVLINEVDIDQEQLKSLPAVDNPKIITYQQKTDMVVSQASVLGVTLSETDVAQIAQNVDSQGTETDELISEIRGAISAYIQYQKQSSQAKIQTLLADINHEQSQANQEISQALSTGLQHFAREMEVSRHSFKSSVRASLKLLTVPQE